MTRCVVLGLMPRTHRATKMGPGNKSQGDNGVQTHSPLLSSEAGPLLVGSGIFLTT